MKGRGELLGTGYEANGSTAEVDQVMQRYLESTGVSSNRNPAYGNANMGEGM